MNLIVKSALTAKLNARSASAKSLSFVLKSLTITKRAKKNKKSSERKERKNAKNKKKNASNVS